MSKSIVLLSGGLDSATTLAIAKQESDDVYALTFDYGQRHRKEVERAKAIADQLGVKEHRILEIGLDELGGSALTDESQPIPDYRDFETMKEEIPSTYVPARNLVLLSCALAWSQALGAGAIYIGANARDYSGYPDCRPSFYKAFQRAAELGTRSGVEKHGVEIRHPLINMRKADIIKKGDMATIKVKPSRPMVIEKAADVPQLSRFAIRDMGMTIAAGVCVDLIPAK